jgi:hypothetical protein
MIQPRGVTLYLYVDVERQAYVQYGSDLKFEEVNKTVLAHRQKSKEKREEHEKLTPKYREKELNEELTSKLSQAGEMNGNRAFRRYLNPACEAYIYNSYYGLEIMNAAVVEEVRLRMLKTAAFLDHWKAYPGPLGPFVPVALFEKQHWCLWKERNPVVYLRIRSWARWLDFLQ